MRRPYDRRTLRARHLAVVGAAGILVAGSALPLLAQSRSSRWVSRSDDGAYLEPTPMRPQSGAKDGSILGMAKWVTLAISAGASGYGFHVNTQADDTFREIEAICEAEPDRCESRDASGAFADDALEARYQSVLDKDRTARGALILAQVSLAATVVLFIMDLDGGEAPPDIPFDPPRITFSGDRAQVYYSVPLPRH